MSESPPPNLEGLLVADRYRVERLIGQGGMGSVWAGRHVTLGQLVAIKFIHEKLAGSREALRRFDLEAKVPVSIDGYQASETSLDIPGNPITITMNTDISTIYEVGG